MTAGRVRERVYLAQGLRPLLRHPETGPSWPSWPKASLCEREPLWVAGDDGELRPWHYAYEGRRGRWGTPTMELQGLLEIKDTHRP